MGIKKRIVTNLCSCNFFSGLLNRFDGRRPSKRFKNAYAFWSFTLQGKRTKMRRHLQFLKMCLQSTILAKLYYIAKLYSTYSKIILYSKIIAIIIQQNYRNSYRAIIILFLKFDKTHQCVLFFEDNFFNARPFVCVFFL